MRLIWHRSIFHSPMTSFTEASSGTESQPSVPVAAQGALTDPAAAAAAFQTILNAMATFTHASSPSEPVPAPVATPAAVLASAAPLVAPVGFRTRGPWVSGALYQVVPVGPLTAIAEEETAADSTPYWYCITRGKYVGVTLSHALVLAAVSGVSRSLMKAYKTQILAVESSNEMLAFGMVAVIAT
ncbi:hypothetical protein B0H19DRAFT_1261105 [Mycena capillaripes]|nr:hypothetical protein B0H19DRAFT_1261105 [Mycena capillaripes]